MKNSNQEQVEKNAEMVQAFIWQLARVDLPKLTQDTNGDYHLHGRHLDRKPLGGN